MPIERSEHQPGVPSSDAHDARQTLADAAFDAMRMINPASEKGGEAQRITASYYGDELRGSPTATGEPYDPDGLTAASKTLPLGTIVNLTNPANGQSVDVRVNDRGPYVDGRDLDCSKGAAQALGFVDSGTAQLDMRVKS